MVRLESLGFLKLPKKRINNGGKPPLIDDEPPAEARRIVTKMPRQVDCRLVQNHADARLWNGLVGHFHYLGLATPVGRTLRYLLYGDDALLGAISFGEAAWNVESRDTVLAEIGIHSTELRGSVVGNNRFLILPNVRVPNLASRVLAVSLRAMRDDWTDRYLVSPLVVETFVDPRRFEGTCYRAANWVLVGSTKGYAKRGACHTYLNAPKLLFLKGLTPLIHRRLAENATECERRAA